MAKTRPHARSKRAKGMENPEGSLPQGRGPRGQSGRRTPALHKLARLKNMPRHRQWETLQRWVLTWRARPDVPPEVIEKLNTLQDKLQVAEEELHQQEEELLAVRQVVEAERQRYQELFDFAPDGYLMTDPAGVIQEANRAAAALLNAPSAFLVNKRLVAFVAPTERKAFRAQLIHLLQARQVDEWAVHIRPRGGAPFEASLTVAVAHDPKGQVVSLYWLLQDITRRKQAEEALRQAKEAAEAANRTKSEFLATMSHELRTPLNVILGYSQLMAEGEFGPLTDAQDETLERVRRNAIELHSLITSVLDLRRLEAGRMPVDVKEVQVPALLEELMAETQEAYQRSRLHFDWEIGAELAPIRTDPEKLKVVLRNLIGNAVKFTPQGSITVKASPKSGGVEVSVTDTGIGIPPEAQSRIFEPFWQVEHPMSPKAGGTGLGLHIVKRLLDLLDGTVTVESTVGQGSTFRVWVPQMMG